MPDSQQAISPPLPNYQRYDLTELHEALSKLDEQRFPERKALIEEHIKTRLEAGIVMEHDYNPHKQRPQAIPFAVAARLRSALWWREWFIFILLLGASGACIYALVLLKVVDLQTLQALPYALTDRQSLMALLQNPRIEYALIVGVVVFFMLPVRALANTMALRSLLRKRRANFSISVVPTQRLP